MAYKRIQANTDLYQIHKGRTSPSRGFWLLDYHFPSRCCHRTIMASKWRPKGDLCACLSRESPLFLGKVIFIPFQPVFSLGRDRTQCDYIISRDAQCVGPVHVILSCSLSADNKRYELSARIPGPGTLFKTFVNGNLIQCGTNVQLKPNDVLTLGDHDSDRHSFRLFVYTPHSMQSKLDLGQIIGRGGFGVVCQARSRKTGAIYALKVVKTKNTNGQVDETARREVQNMRQIKHPFIVTLVGYFMETTFIYMILELGSGTVADIVYPRGPHEPRATGEMLLLFVWVVKLADFGLSKDMTENPECQTFCGTSIFMAPEIPCTAWMNYSYPADLYSLGATLYVMLAGAHAPCPSDHADFHWPHMPISQEEIAKLVVQSMMLTVPRHRPTAGQVLDSAWVGQL
ncbi:hypothetical protein NM688_g9395 [Phlebia brevispora]|uniref:Uncharacterized protein n=1 Tax=Phlebia brevispora TaxID=194682 RepID=A0ACC1RHE0_9APHY|nr:hypothetical protein NM688_g9395 [Phlebia brevispora]